MRTRTISLMVFIFCLMGLLNAQNITIKGKMDISITKGTIQCDFTVTNLPRIKNYYIFLNSGLNIRYFRNLDDNYNYAYEKQYGDTVPGECFGYYFPDNTGKAKFLPKGVEVNYTGAFPVISDTLKASDRGDWKGNIAFNGKTIRATEQSAWYPILYDISKDIQYTKVAYDIDVTCNDCDEIYLNGSTPIKGHTAHLKSDSAFELLLFAGNYKVDTSNNTYFLNTDMSREQLKKFGEMTDNYKKYYAKNLSIPYTYDITYVRTTPVSKRNGFLFVTYPSITSVGWDNGFQASFGKNGDWFRPFIAHELGHYYFGTYARFNSELGDAITEAFAEYMSFKVTEHLISDTIYNIKIDNCIRALKNFNPVPIGNIKSADDIKDRETYVYTYFPIILTAIEKEIGEQKMWKWMRLLLTTKTEFTNYEFLKGTLSVALKDDAKVDSIDKKYFKSDTSVQNAIATVQKK